jgi:hypothetical protein
MNVGVSTIACAVNKRPRRALDSPSVAPISKVLCTDREVPRNRAAKQIQSQNILCGLRFCPYIRGSPHQARDELVTHLGGFFVAGTSTLRAALCI